MEGLTRRTMVRHHLFPFFSRQHPYGETKGQEDLSSFHG